MYFLNDEKAKFWKLSIPTTDVAHLRRKGDESIGGEVVKDVTQLFLQLIFSQDKVNR